MTTQSLPFSNSQELKDILEQNLPYNVSTPQMIESYLNKQKWSYSELLDTEDYPLDKISISIDVQDISKYSSFMVANIEKNNESKKLNNLSMSQIISYFKSKLVSWDYRVYFLFIDGKLVDIHINVLGIGF